MRRSWSRLTALLLVGIGAWVGLAAREDKDGLPDDLARVPAKAQGVLSVRVADLWSSELGKELRKGFPKELTRSVEEFKATFGVAPEELERITYCAASLLSPDEVVLFARASAKLDAKKLFGKLVPDGKEETLGGQKVLTARGHSAFLSADGRTLVFGPRPGVEKLLESKPGKPTGALAVMLAKAAKHSVAGYVDPAALAAMSDKLPPPLVVAKPLLAATDGVAWLDVGYTSKLGARITFADDKAAAKGRKVLDAGRALGSLTLSGLGDTIAAKSKPIAALLTKVEKMLDDGTVEQKGTAVEAALELTVEKAAVAELIKEVMTKVVEASLRMRAQNNLKQIGLAFHNYHDVNGALPPAAVYDKDGKALLSWRVLVLPYLDQDALYKEFKLDEAWDSPHNKKLIAKIPPTYVAPHGKAAAGGTFYQGFHGKMASFEGKRGLRFADFTDGLSNTLLVAEAAKDVPWTKPDDLPFDADGKLPKLGVLEAGANALFGDGSVRFLSAKVKPETLKAMITRNGGEVAGADD